MTFLRKAAILVATAAMTIGLAGVSSPANAADTGWDCPGMPQRSLADQVDLRQIAEPTTPQA